MVRLRAVLLRDDYHELRGNPITALRTAAAERQRIWNRPEVYGYHCSPHRSLSRYLSHPLGMSSMQVSAGVEEASISAVVVRCGCPPGEMDHPDRPCYRPRAYEDRGVIARYRPNRIKRFLRRLK